MLNNSQKLSETANSMSLCLDVVEQATPTNQVQILHAKLLPHWSLTSGKNFGKTFWDREFDQEWSKRKLQVTFFHFRAIRLVHCELENESLQWDVISVEENYSYSLHQSLFWSRIHISKEKLKHRLDCHTCKNLLDCIQRSG